PIDTVTHESTVTFFETLLKVLHPFMPFITEELWHELRKRTEKDCIIISRWPKSSPSNGAILKEGTFAFEIITEIRNTRNTKSISPKDALKLVVKSDKSEIDLFWPIIKKLSNLSEVLFSAEKLSNTTSFHVQSTEFFIPIEGKIDVAKEREAIQNELEYQKGFLLLVNKKLSNEKFVNGAPPAVIDTERKKKADAEAKIKALEETLRNIQ
ncbi:MAG: class I tRNA ligase family protein, partial [Bacteroidia bacterium]|nr:class I tRNA ligase family protein [Bacteroidia bacterium]